MSAEWLLGLPTAGAVCRFMWCLHNGIDPLTAEPRDRYEQLRGARRTPATSQGKLP